jgi:hypothetical protein
MIKLNSSCKRIDTFTRTYPVGKRSYEVYVEANHRCVGRCRESMSMNRYFQHANLLTTRTTSSLPPDVLTLKLPRFVCVFETLQSALKTKMTNLWVVYFTNGIVLLTSKHDNIGRHDSFRCGFLLWKRKSIMLLRQSRDIESAISLLTPGMNSILNENTDKAISHRIIIGLEWFLMCNKLRWSVRIVNERSRNTDCKYVHAKKIAYASFWITAHRSWALLSDLLTNAIGVSYRQLTKKDNHLHHSPMHQCASISDRCHVRSALSRILQS